MIRSSVTSKSALQFPARMRYSGKWWLNRFTSPRRSSSSQHNRSTTRSRSSRDKARRSYSALGFNSTWYRIPRVLSDAQSLSSGPGSPTMNLVRTVTIDSRERTHRLPALAANPWARTFPAQQSCNLAYGGYAAWNGRRRARRQGNSTAA